MEFEEKVKLLKKARAYWTWGLIINPLLNPFFFIPIIGFILKYLGVRLVAKATDNYKISRYYGLGLLFFLFFPIAIFMIAISLREAGKELNNIRFIKADKWYYWSAIALGIGMVFALPSGGVESSPILEILVGLSGGIALFSLIVGWVYEVQGVWHLHEISEEMNSSEIEQKEE
jgi:uncharacterized membrane protein